jgi:predicted HicB family RNase H-like nuclease
MQVYRHENFLRNSVVSLSQECDHDRMRMAISNFSPRRRLLMPETVVHFQVRMPPDIHERLASWAKADKASLNQLVVDILEKAIDNREGQAVGVGSGPAHERR